MLGIMAVVFIGVNSWGKKKNQQREAEHQRMLSEEMVPGAWVHTRVGFYGRFVDLDGDVVILETPGGTETYWNRAIIASVGELPFADDPAEADEADVDVVVVEEDLATGELGESDTAK